jgi:hypothetical protein
MPAVPAEVAPSGRLEIIVTPAGPLALPRYRLDS